MSSIGENYRRILERIAAASARAGRDPSSVRLVGVTKRVDLARVREAIACGLTDVGENKIQEAEQKIPMLESDRVTAHLIGHLQSNKVRRAVELFGFIQSLDSISLARRLDQATPRPLRVLIQVKLENEATKSGVTEESLADLIEVVRASDRLDLRGLMTIPPFMEPAVAVRPHFCKLRRLVEAHNLPELSMGMSHDYEIAVEEGATMVRVGTALFGARS